MKTDTDIPMPEAPLPDAPLRNDMLPKEPPTLEELAKQVELLFKFVTVLGIVIKQMQIAIDGQKLDSEVLVNSYDTTLNLIGQKLYELELILATADLAKGQF